MDVNVTARGIPGLVELVELGDAREEVRSRLGAYREFRRTPDANPSDQFTSGPMITYDGEGGRVLMIEIASPTIAHLDGIPLNERRVKDVLRDLAERKIPIDRDEMWLPDTGLWLYVEGNRITGVQVGMD